METPLPAAYELFMYLCRSSSLLSHKHNLASRLRLYMVAEVDRETMVSNFRHVLLLITSSVNLLFPHLFCFMDELTEFAINIRIMYVVPQDKNKGWRAVLRRYEGAMRRGVDYFEVPRRGVGSARDEVAWWVNTAQWRRAQHPQEHR